MCHQVPFSELLTPEVRARVEGGLLKFLDCLKGTFILAAHHHIRTTLELVASDHSHRLALYRASDWVTRWVCTSSAAALASRWQSWACTTDASWPANPVICTKWPFQGTQPTPGPTGHGGKTLVVTSRQILKVSGVAKHRWVTSLLNPGPVFLVSQAEKVSSRRTHKSP